MIDEDRIATLVDLAMPLPEASRLVMLDGLTHLPLSAAAWRRATPLINSVYTEVESQGLDVLARVPLLSLRRALRQRAQATDDALGLRIALALAEQHDASGVPRLIAEFASGPTVDVARALACVLAPVQGVAAEDLAPGLAANDEMVRLWTVIATSRVLRRDGSGPDLEPLECLWDAFVRQPGSAASKRLFDGPPGVFRGDPAWAAGQVAAVRPLPEAAVGYLLALKENDFDGWQPRDPLTTRDSKALHALVAGLTGLYSVDGDPLPTADRPAPRPSAPIVSAAAFKSSLDAIAAKAVSAPEFPPWLLGNELLDLGQSVSPGSPVAIRPVLADRTLLDRLPRRALAWTLARNGPERVVDELSAILASRPDDERAEAVDWLRDIAAEVGTWAPYQGSGGEPTPPPPLPELIDDGVELELAAPDLPAAGEYDLLEADTSALGGFPPPADLELGDASRLRSEASAQPAFHFVLTGDDALGDAIVAGGRATLEFRFDLPPVDALAQVDSVDLDQARTADRNILLEVTPTGNLTLVGARQGVARFDAGRLRAPVPFQLEAGAPDPTSSGVHVEFIVLGETVHQVDLPIVVLADRAALQQRAKARREGHAGAAIDLGLLDDAAAASPPPPQRIRLALALDAKGLRIDLTHWVGDQSEAFGPFVSDRLDRARLETLVESLRRDLAGCYASPLWAQFTGAIGAGESANLARAELPRTCSTVAAAGARLNQALRENSPAIAQALDCIEARLPAGSTLTIATDGIYLPWEILYPRPWRVAFTDRQREEFPLEPKLFWGARFAIETIQLRNTGSLVELRKKHLARPPKASVNLNPKIAVQGLSDTEQPLAVQRAWADSLAQSGQLETVQDECHAMRHVLQDAVTDASLLYIYCHGSAARPFGGSDELLELAKGCMLNPPDLQGNAVFPGAPIVFLNACEAGAHSPLAFSSFLSAFRLRGALGMIATSFAVPIVFGAHFGAEVAQCVLARRGSLADAMRRLRQRHLIDRGNPIPLFYALQCQMTYPPGDAE